MVINMTSEVVDYLASKREAAREKSRQWRLANPERMREARQRHYKENRDRILEANRQWRKKHPDRAREIGRRTRARNHERVKEQARRSYAKNRDLHLSRVRDTRLKRIFNTPIERYEAILAEQNGVCAMCKQENIDGRRLAVDHDHHCCPGERSCGKCVRGLLCSKCNT